MAGLHDIVPCRIRENSELGLLAVRSAVVYDVASFSLFRFLGRRQKRNGRRLSQGPLPDMAW